MELTACWGEVRLVLQEDAGSAFEEKVVKTQQSSLDLQSLAAAGSGHSFRFRVCLHPTIGPKKLETKGDEARRKAGTKMHAQYQLLCVFADCCGGSDTAVVRRNPGGSGDKLGHFRLGVRIALFATPGAGIVTITLPLLENSEER